MKNNNPDSLTLRIATLTNIVCCDLPNDSAIVLCCSPDFYCFENKQKRRFMGFYGLKLQRVGTPNFPLHISNAAT